MTKIERELSDNRQLYSDFDDCKEEDLSAYIKDKKYNSSLVDLVPYVVANITNVRIEILEVRDDRVSPTQIAPRNMPPVERTIYVCKIDEHYDAILDAEKAASGLKVEGEPDIIVC